MSKIKAGTTSGTALVTEGDTTGQLVFQTNGTTTALTLGTDQSATFAGNVVVSGSIAVPSPLTVTGNSTAGAEIRLPEDTDNGSNYVALKAPNSLASNLTLTLPTADGTSGQVIQTDGAGQLSFATPAGGSWTYIKTVTAASSATVDIEDTFTGYDMYAIVFVNISTSTSELVYARLKIGGSYVSTTHYAYNYTEFSGSSGFANEDTMLLMNNSTTSGYRASGVIYIPLPASTSVFKGIYSNIFWINGGSTPRNRSASGAYLLNTNALTGIRIYPSSGVISTGTFRLYGIKNS